MSITTNESGGTYSPSTQKTNGLIHITRAGRVRTAIRGPLKLMGPDPQYRLGSVKKGA